ncbi:MAG: DUF3365 domain-containing protein [Nitrospirae bacterium]|nr:MAG: DUF3365 domain-containing protein [Nitrospirota bacterium]
MLLNKILRPDRTSNNTVRLKNYITILLVVWTAVVSASFLLTRYKLEEEFSELARVEARTSFKKDKIYRDWNAMHGGVYVPVTDKTRPNPYLSNLPERDISTAGGKTLTLMNPSYMTRQVFELTKKDMGIVSRITSLKPLNPENTPDPLETKALRSFEQGSGEFSSRVEVGGEPFMRLIKPLFVSQSCLKCHASQGYNTGDVRGGISVSVPMKPYLSAMNMFISLMSAAHVSVWMAVISLIVFGGKKIVQKTEEVERARDSAETANRAKSSFLSMMSHDIRTPMNAIIGMTGIVLDMGVSDRQRDYLKTVQQASNSLMALLNNILDLSKIESGKLELENVEMNLNALLADTLGLYTIEAGKKKNKLSYYISPDVCATLTGDPGRLSQVLTNLVSNAIKFTADGEVTVEVRKDASLDSLSNNVVCLLFSVKDTGVGIPESKQSLIFDTFAQAEISTGRKYGGTGLGLAICREIVRLMKGRIWVESEPGKGSVFKFTACFGTGKTATPPSGSDEGRTYLQKPIEDIKELDILLVEDNIMNQELALILLARQGHSVVCAANGMEALEAINNQKFDIVLMDVRMPEIDGFEATGIIKRFQNSHINFGVPVIAMTANDMNGDRQRCIEAGMDDYISKPIHAGQLQETINRCVKKHAVLKQATLQRA